MTHIDKPAFFLHGRKYSLSKINDVKLSDPGFMELISIIEKHTGVKQISFTTGPKRGEIVWADETSNSRFIKE